MLHCPPPTCLLYFQLKHCSCLLCPLTVYLPPSSSLSLCLRAQTFSSSLSLLLLTRLFSPLLPISPLKIIFLSFCFLSFPTDSANSFLHLTVYLISDALFLSFAFLSGIYGCDLFQHFYILHIDLPMSLTVTDYSVVISSLIEIKKTSQLE